jgi:hypothetical protein
MNLKKSMVYRYFCLVIYFVFAFASKVEFGSEIFKENYGARNAALGGVSLNLIGGSNPAMLINSNETILDFSHMNKFGGLYKLNSISYLNFKNEESPILVSIINRIIEDIPDTRGAWIDNGDFIPTQGEINYFKIKNFSQKEIGLKFSFLKKIDKFVVGYSFKPSYISILDFNAWGISFDFSILKQFYYKKIDFSIRLEDVFNYKRWSTKSYENTVPFLAFGGNIKLSKTLFSFDLSSALKENTSLNYNTGFEYYQENEIVILRCGTSNNNLFTLGVGTKFNSFNIDYAFVYYSIEKPFEPSQILSISINLDKSNWIKSKLDP